MSEPTLETIEDYNTLKGEKKKIVWAVVLVGLVIGAIYVVAGNVYATPADSIQTEDSIKNIPLK